MAKPIRRPGSPLEIQGQYLGEVATNTALESLQSDGATPQLNDWARLTADAADNAQNRVAGDYVYDGTAWPLVPRSALGGAVDKTKTDQSLFNAIEFMKVDNRKLNSASVNSMVSWIGDLADDSRITATYDGDPNYRITLSDSNGVEPDILLNTAPIEPDTALVPDFLDIAVKRDDPLLYAPNTIKAVLTRIPRTSEANRNTFDNSTASGRFVSWPDANGNNVFQQKISAGTYETISQAEMHVVNDEAALLAIDPATTNLKSVGVLYETTVGDGTAGTYYLDTTTTPGTPFWLKPVA